VLFASAFFSAHAGNMIFLLYVVGIAIAVILGRVFKMILFRGEQLPFVMELPPYRIPTATAAFIHMWERGKVYLKKMGGVILVASVILWFLGEFPRLDHNSPQAPGTVGEFQASPPAAAAESSAAAEMRYSFIGRLGEALSPAVAPLGFNWQMGVSLLTGFFAKEVVVSSMGVLYQVGEESAAESGSLIAALRNPENGITNLTAFCFMLFVLLYTPCITVLLAIKREIGVRWAISSVALQLTVAWLSALVVYRFGLWLGLG
jgi:ferrous iron transport protein B